MTINFKDLLETSQLEAIYNKISPDETYLHRYFCREYSKTFHEPLSKVLNMPVEIVLQHIYEERFSDIDLLDNLEKFDLIIKQIEDPNYNVNKNKEFDDFIKRAELAEQKRIKEGRKVGISKSLFKKDEPVKENMPTGGSINMGYLAKMDGEE